MPDPVNKPADEPVRMVPTPPEQVAAVVGKDGLVRVADAISKEAVKEGFAPDVQPKALDAPH